MILAFLIPGPLRRHSAEMERVEIDADVRDVGAALEALFTRHRGLRDRVLDERGRIRPHVNVFVGTESVRWTGGLATPLSGERAVISIAAAVSGG